MQNQVVKMFVKSVPVRQIIATTSEWIHALGSDESVYLVPTVSRTYSYQSAYFDSIFLRALGIKTLDSEVLSFCHNVPLTAGADSAVVRQGVVGWRLPSEIAGERLFQILPSNWLLRVANRTQFLEVLMLDLWFRRSGQREVIFRQTGEEIEAIFLPSGSSYGVQTCTFEEVGYHKRAVYDGLQWARIEADLKAKLASLTLSKLGRQFQAVPQFGVQHEVLKSLWFEAVVNKVSFDQCLADAMGRLFGGVVQTNHESTFQVSATRLRGISNSSSWYSVGCPCG